MSTENFIERMSEMRDRAKADIEALARFNVGTMAGSARDDGRLLAHLEGTVERCEELILRAQGDQVDGGER